jgi:hypothetical protein
MDACAAKKSGFFSDFASNRPYDGHLDEAVDPSAHLSGLKLLRRTELIITGNPEHVQELGTAATVVQRELAANPDRKVDMRVVAFMDDCLHSTGWSTTPKDVTNGFAAWECYETETRFVEAFRRTAEEFGRRGRIDSVIIVGNRFDESVGSVQSAARSLRELGVLIHALVLSGTDRLLEQFKAVTDVAKGHAVAVKNGDGVREAMPLLMRSMFPYANLAALPAPKDPGARELVRLLAAPTTAA